MAVPTPTALPAPGSQTSTLRELRRALGLTQIELGERLGKPQEEISRIERRADLRLSTLRAYVHALGGHLQLRCEFAHRPAVSLSPPAGQGQTARVLCMPTDRIVGPHRAALSALCERYSVRRLALFGSALREDFDPRRSDLDFAVDFAHSSTLSPAQQYFDFKGALEQLFARPVDLVELRALAETRLKRLIQRTQRAVYEQAP